MRAEETESPSGMVWRAQIRKLGKQIAVRPYPILGHLPVGEHGHEGITGVVGVTIKVDDIAPSGYAINRATARQRKTGRPVRFEMTEHTRHAVDDYLKFSRKKLGEFLFTGPKSGYSMTSRQYGRLVSDWFTGVGLDPHLYGTHSLRRTKATHIDRRTGNLRAVQLLLGHTKIESTVRYLGIDVDDALAIAE